MSRIAAKCQPQYTSPLTTFTARTGSAKRMGPGLAIVASIVQAHRGRDSPKRIESGGLAVTVKLPI